MIVTDDNPRSEEPAAIRAAVLAGARGAATAGVRVLDGGDRRAAIHAALDLAEPGDWVAVLLGKGHETGQTIGDGDPVRRRTGRAGLGEEALMERIELRRLAEWAGGRPAGGPAAGPVEPDVVRTPGT